MAEKKTKKKVAQKPVETTNKQLSPEEIVNYFKEKLGTNIKSVEIKKRATGSKKKEFINIWMKIDKSIFKNFIEHLCNLTYPHLAVCSGNDFGDQIELVYSFSLYYGKHLQEISLNVGVQVPKSKPEIETICDWIPGALITEREKQEMLGIKIIGIPDNRRLFLPDDFPENVYPWRKDEQTKKEIEKLYKNLHEGVKK